MFLIYPGLGDSVYFLLQFRRSCLDPFPHHNDHIMMLIIKEFGLWLLRCWERVIWSGWRHTIQPQTLHLKYRLGLKHVLSSLKVKHLKTLNKISMFRRKWCTAVLGMSCGFFVFCWDRWPNSLNVTPLYRRLFGTLFSRLIVLIRSLTNKMLGVTMNA